MMNGLLRISAFLLLATACNTAPVSEIQKINTSELLEMMDKENDLVIIDVRTPAETAQGTIPGSIQIDWQDSEFNNNIADLDPEKPVVVYCASGLRSAQAAQVLHSANFKRVYDYSEGYYGWLNNN